MLTFILENKPLLSFVKMEVYLFLFIVGTEIVRAGTLYVDWKLVCTAGILGVIKGLLTWLTTAGGVK